MQLLAWITAQYQAATPGSPRSATSSVFVSKNAALWFLYARKVLHGPDGLGDITYTQLTVSQPSSASTPPVNALWLASPSRGDFHDLVIYYVHGGDFVGASVYVYLEYLCNMLTALLTYGFRNPAIMAIDYSQASYYSQLDQVCRGWNHLHAKHGYSTLVLAGDSNGASLCLSLLLHHVNPHGNTTKVPHKPHAALLVSPWAQLYNNRESNKSDYLTPKMLLTYGRQVHLPETSPNMTLTQISQAYIDPYASPANCTSIQWWTKAMPCKGLYITYGSEEILAPEIRRFYNRLRRCGDVQVDERPGQIHSWPITLHLFGRSSQARDLAVDIVAHKICLMVGWAASTNINIELP